MNFSVEEMEPRSLDAWHRARELLDMSPSFQRRGGLWSTQDRALLIDSILNGFDVPKFYLADYTRFNTTIREGRQPYAVIDGRQRFEALFGYLDGDFPLSSSFRLFDEPSRDVAGSKFQDLLTWEPDLAKRLLDWQPSVWAVLTNSNQRIHQMFVRLNRNKGLTGAEVRNAMDGPVPEVIRELAAHVFFTEFVSFSVRRGGDLNTAAKLLMYEFRGHISATKKRDLNNFVREGEGAEAEPYLMASSDVSVVLDHMCEGFRLRDPLLGRQGWVLPYYLLFRELSSEPATRLREFLQEIRQREQQVRGEMRDVGERGVHDPEMLTLLNHARNVNDASGIKGMAEMLRDLYIDWA